MAVYEENILQQLLHTTALPDVSKEQLQELIDKYPYYDAPYFFLAKKFYQLKDVDNRNVVQKAALHFSNDLWFRFNLDSEEPVANGKVDDEAGLDAPATINENVADNGEEVKEDLNEKLSSILQEQAAEFDKPVTVTEQVPVETIPYHRVDYFDSQGIKLEEEKINDKLGTQLKRFTEWLRQMKRINSNPGELGNDEAGETVVQHIAEDSNKTRQIVTEAMAEVLAKQGKPEQAIEIYEKLSFNNPSKSAYFAAKIAELKN